MALEINTKSVLLCVHIGGGRCTVYLETKFSISKINVEVSFLNIISHCLECSSEFVNGYILYETSDVVVTFLLSMRNLRLRKLKM